MSLSFRVVLKDVVREVGGGEIVWASQVSSVENTGLVLTPTVEDISISSIENPESSIDSLNSDPVFSVKFASPFFLPLPAGDLGIMVRTSNNLLLKF